MGGPTLQFGHFEVGGDHHDIPAAVGAVAMGEQESPLGGRKGSGGKLQPGVISNYDGNRRQPHRGRRQNRQGPGAPERPPRLGRTSCAARCWRSGLPESLDRALRRHWEWGWERDWGSPPCSAAVRRWGSRWRPAPLTSPGSPCWPGPAPPHRPGPPEPKKRTQPERPVEWPAPPPAR